MSDCQTNAYLFGRLMSIKRFVAGYYIAKGLSAEDALEKADKQQYAYYWRALYAQAFHETGGFHSHIYRVCSNMFGMKAPNSRRLYCKIQNGYACYSSYGLSILDRVKWDLQKSDFEAPENDNEVLNIYFPYLLTHNYATDPDYLEKVRNIYTQLFINGNQFNDDSASNDYGDLDDDDGNINQTTKGKKLLIYFLFGLFAYFGYKHFKK